MKQLRTVTVLIALLMSGLAFVVVAPAPPAAADLQMTLTQGSIDVDAGLTPYCALTSQYESAWLRRFDLGKEGVLGGFTPQEVAFGVDWLRMAPGKAFVSVRVRVYAFPADDVTLTRDELQRAPYVEDTVELAELPPHRLAIAYPTTVQGSLRAFNPVTEDAVVEVHYAGGVPTERFTIGSNIAPETAPGYRWLGHQCYPNEIETIAPGRSVVIAVNGVDAGKSDHDGDGVLDIPDQDPCPHVYGSRLNDPPGCPVFRQQVSATFKPAAGKISGEVYGGAVDACRGWPKVTIVDANTGLEIATVPTVGEARAYEWSTLGWAIGRVVFAKVETYMDRDVKGDGLARCLGASSELVITADDDNDLVPDSNDRCRGLVGTPSTEGCPSVAMAITPTVSANGVVSGTLKVAAGAIAPKPGACQRAHEVVLSVGSSTYRAPVAATSGAFSFAGPNLTDTQKYTLSAAHYIDTDLSGIGVAWCAETKTEELAAFVDSDNDQVGDLTDSCPTTSGLGGGDTPDPSQGTNDYPGCPLIERKVTADYADGEVSGVVEVVSDVRGLPCMPSTTIEVLEVLDGGGTRSLATSTAIRDERFTIDVDIAEGTKFRVRAAEYFDTGIAVCLQATSVDKVAGDSDGDGVLHSVDGCPAVWGPKPVGCPLVPQQVTATYEDGAITGDVTVVRPAGVPATLCAVWVVEVWQVGPGARTRVQKLFTAGSFKVSVGAPDDGAKFQAYVLRWDYPGQAICQAGESEVVEVLVDTDGDDVRDRDDPCQEVKEGSGVFFSGCPDLDRAVTASYADGVVSGTVSFVDGRATSSACATATQVKARVYEVGSDGEPFQIGETSYSPSDGRYAITLDSELPYGIKYHVVVIGGVDPAAGYCSGADSGEHTVADPDPDRDEVRGEDDDCPQVDDLGDTVDGCPELTRTVTASYVGGEISGVVTVVDPQRAPAGACVPTQVRAYTIRDGVVVQVGATTTTTATGSYTIALGDALAAGSTYYVSTERYRDGQKAVCAEAASASQQVRVVVVDPPGDPVPPGVPVPPGEPVPPTEPVPPGSQVPPGGVVVPVGPVLWGVKLTRKAIHVVTARATPRSTKLKLGLNVPAKVVVAIKGTSKATGKKVRAKLVLTLAAGASSIKLTGKVGTKRLPPGRYTVLVRATNPAGAATATAGRLRLKP